MVSPVMDQRATNGRFVGPSAVGFQPGKSGRDRTPQGVLTIFASFAGEFGGDAMSDATRTELMAIADLMFKAKRTKDAAAAARASNSARHLFADLRRRTKHTSPSSLSSNGVRDSLLRSRDRVTEVERSK
jgi:hypothetical protein